MSVEVKKEFKEFVGVLSKNICEDILREDIKKINSDYTKNNNEHKRIIQENKKCIIDMNMNSTSWKKEGEKVKQMVDTLGSTNKLLLEALNIIDKNQTKGLEKIVKENNILLNQYRADIHKLNDEERRKFINELTNKVNIGINSNIEEVKKSVSSEKFKIMNDNTALVLEKLCEREKEIEKNNIATKKRIGALEESVVQLGQKVENMGSRHTRIMNEMKLELEKKNNIIMGLIVVCILISFFVR